MRDEAELRAQIDDLDAFLDWMIGRGEGGSGLMDRIVGILEFRNGIAYVLGLPQICPHKHCGEDHDGATKEMLERARLIANKLRREKESRVN